MSETSDMERLRTRPHSDWKDGFLFVGNQPALDFVNTRPLQDGQYTELLPDFQALLRWFQAAGLLDRKTASKLAETWDGSAKARRAVAQMRDWRERLRSEIVSWESGNRVRQRTLGELNRLMQAHPMLARITNDTGRLRAELWFDPKTPADLIAPLAHSAADLFSSADRSRVRMCGNCVLHFYDTSKKGTRHWCSMRLCGNRQKAAAYAERRRKGRRSKRS